MPNVLSRATRLATDLLFPPRCGLCGEDGSLLCDRCIDGLPPADGERCERCWMPVRHDALCAHCVHAPPAFASLRAAFVMDAGARRLAHELKYEGLTSLAEPMGQAMFDRLARPSADLVVPLPLHRSRERARGYNQAALLAREIARLAGLPLDAGAARRVRATAPLVKTMHREERLAIVRGAFTAKRDAVEGRAILLVDDVVTTGATLDACSEALIAAGAIQVNCMTWARAD
jgi:ComF family protein